MTQLAILNNQLPAHLTGVNAEIPSDLEESVRASFAVVGVKGKVFSVKFGGETQQVLNADGYPAQYLDVVLVSANPHLNKTYYASTFTDDSAERPDCWSDNGTTPAAPNPVHHSCALCPKNMYGSRVTDNGSKSKACSDNRKVVVVPASNILNERFGGGMLLRIAPTGLQDLKTYSSKLRSGGVPYYAVVTRLSFDPSVAYPKLMYQAVSYLTAEQYEQVMTLRDSEQTNHILTDSFVPEFDAQVTSLDGLGAPPAHVPPPVVQQPAAPAPAPAPATPPAPPAPAATRQRTRRTAPLPPTGDTFSTPAPAAQAPAPAAQAPAPVQAGPAAPPAPAAQVEVPAALSSVLSGLFGGT